MSAKRSYRVPGKPVENKTPAERMLSSVPREKAFNFYNGVGKPAGKHAASLQEFSQRLLEVDPSSVVFHLERDDFQKWLRQTIGDKELASTLSGFKGQGLSPEELRQKVQSEVKARFEGLSKR